MPAIVDLAGVSRANAYLIPAEQLRIADDSRRWSDEDVKELAIDIAERGQLMPVLVRWGKTEDGQDCLLVAAGRRRLKAVSYVNEHPDEIEKHVTEMPTLPMKVLSMHFKGAETFAAAVVENRKRKGLSAIDLAFDIRTLLDLGKTRKQIARLLEISEPLISRTLTLLKLPVAIQRDIHKGKISTEAGYEMVPMEPEDREKVFGHHETAASQPVDTSPTEAQPEPRSSRKSAQASRPEAGSSREKVTRSSIRKIKREKAERGEDTAGPIGRSRKEIREIFAGFAACEDGTIEEPIRKLLWTIVSCIDGEVGSLAVLNRMRELAEGAR